MSWFSRSNDADPTPPAPAPRVQAGLNLTLHRLTGDFGGEVSGMASAVGRPLYSGSDAGQVHGPRLLASLQALSETAVLADPVGDLLTLVARAYAGLPTEGETRNSWWELHSRWELERNPEAWFVDALLNIKNSDTLEYTLALAASGYVRSMSALYQAPADVFADEDWSRIAGSNEQISALFTKAYASLERSLELVDLCRTRAAALKNLPEDVRAGDLGLELVAQMQAAIDELATHRAVLARRVPLCVKAAQARATQIEAVRQTLVTQQVLAEAQQLNSAGVASDQALDDLAELDALGSMIDSQVAGDLDQASAEVARQRAIQVALRAGGTGPKH